MALSINQDYFAQKLYGSREEYRVEKITLYIKLKSEEFPLLHNRKTDTNKYREASVLKIDGDIFYIAL